VRNSEGKFLAEGRRVVLEALASEASIDRLFLRDDVALDDIRRAADDRQVEIIDASDAVVRAVSTTTTPQGCVAVVDMPATDVTALPSRVTLGLLLAGVADPGNAGTLLRSGAGAGCDCVLVTRSSVDLFNPKTVRASAGTLFRIPLVSGVSLSQAAAALHDRGCTLVGADARAPVSCYDMDFVPDVCFVLGNEAHGLADAGSSLDAYARLPLPGGIESLNVAVAGSLLLFEAVRQRLPRNAGLSSPLND
jgi:TrmH family RNA methyltransferase